MRQVLRIGYRDLIDKKNFAARIAADESIHLLPAFDSSLRILCDLAGQSKRDLDARSTSPWRNKYMRRSDLRTRIVSAISTPENARQRLGGRIDCARVVGAHCGTGKEQRQRYAYRGPRLLVYGVDHFTATTFTTTNRLTHLI